MYYPDKRQHSSQAAILCQAASKGCRLVAAGPLNALPMLRTRARKFPPEIQRVCKPPAFQKSSPQQPRLRADLKLP